jgi:hypothetical protein
MGPQEDGLSSPRSWGRFFFTRAVDSDFVPIALAGPVRMRPACRFAIRRPRNTPIWKLKCRSCKKGRYAPAVHMIKLTATQEITPYQWVHPDEER